MAMTGVQEEYQIADECGFYFNPLCMGNGQHSLSSNADKTTALHSALQICPICALPESWNQLGYPRASPLLAPVLTLPAFPSALSLHRGRRQNPPSHFVVDMRRYAYPAHFFLLNLCTLHLQFSAK